MILKWKWFVLCIGLIIVFILVVFMVYFYGFDLFFNEELGIFRFFCNRLSFVNKIWLLFYGGLIFLIIIIIIVFLICFYFKIGLNIWDYLKCIKINCYYNIVKYVLGNVLNSDD